MSSVEGVTGTVGTSNRLLQVDALQLQWNPWEAMKDCYQRFACVENAKFNSPAVVQPGESWRAQQEFAVIDL